MDSVKTDTKDHALDKEIEYRTMLNKSPYTSPNHYEEPIDSKKSIFEWIQTAPILIEKIFNCY